MIASCRVKNRSGSSRFAAAESGEAGTVDILRTRLSPEATESEILTEQFSRTRTQTEREGREAAGFGREVGKVATGFEFSKSSLVVRVLALGSLDCTAHF